MGIEYKVNAPITADQFIDLLQRSTLAERRPVDDPDCIAAMLRHANLTVTAWMGAELVGIARSVTDFSYCCYLSDLAVDTAFQRKGIGKALVATTRARLGPRAKIMLIAAPAARGYYGKIGFMPVENCWMMR